ncbi:MAG: error-prone DNA polymerase [Dermabacter sp.]|nr:error-prone DNA polymerase [Dermabacter sp.]
MSRWFLGPPSWRDLEAVLSDRPVQVAPPVVVEHTGIPRPTQGPEPGGEGPDAPRIPYAELHAHSHFSFLDGAASPEEMVEEASRLGLTALALVDHDGFYGAIRFMKAAQQAGMATVYGAELTLGTALGADGPETSAEPRTGQGDPDGEHLLLLARGIDGYRQLSALMARAHLDGPDKGQPRYRRAWLTQAARSGHLVALTGCRKSAVHRGVIAALESGDLEEAAHAAARGIRALLTLTDGARAREDGAPRVVVELPLTGDALESELHDALTQGARIVREEDGYTSDQLPIVATTNAHYAQPHQKRLADVHAALRSRMSLGDANPFLASRLAHLRSGTDMAALVPRYPSAVTTSARLATQLAFDLSLSAPALPPFPTPAEHTEATWLREMTYRKAEERYGPRESERVAGAWAQIDHELRVIEELGFPGYFLIVEDIVAFCEEQGILCQGRGSAANSAVCYCLGITSVDPVFHGLLFERFLAPERDGPPDIDIDIASDRREEVIQFVYDKYGRENAAQVANVITYRARLAVRDAARALGYSVGQQDAYAKRVERSFTALSDADLPDDVTSIAFQLRDAPRHLGIHSGGMVLCDRPMIDVVPIEHARMDKRTVIQWDKDDCADAGLVKFDLLGLGMLTALDHCLRIVREVHGEDFTLATLPQEDPAVYDMLCAGDAVGVFQVESRAQIATLPRLKPRKFYDLVVEVALIRPGPIQGGSVHPYLRRRSGQEEVTYLHPLLEKSLGRTLGVPLFQEQLMHMVVDVADFTPAQADQLRRAMGSKRSAQKMTDMREAMFTGMANNGIVGEKAELIFRKILAFASYGFPESHGYSFAYLVYASAFLKCHFPAAFTAALLRSQPMGFYSPQSLVADARRHGVTTLGVDIAHSAAMAGLELGDGRSAPTFASRAAAAGADGGTPVQVRGREAEAGPAIRLGLDSVRGISTELAHAIVNDRAASGPFASVPDLARRTGLSTRQVEALATAGALDSLAQGRRAALWAAGAARSDTPGTIAGIDVGHTAPTLPGMSAAELMAADTWATGVSAKAHPMALLRERLTEDAVEPIAHLANIAHGTRVWSAGIITHRQRPATASGVTFLGLEDETGILNVVCSVGFWRSHRILLRSASAVRLRGIVEKNEDGVVSFLADAVLDLPLGATSTSRNFC